MRFNKYWMEANGYLPWTSGYACTNADQDTASFYNYKVRWWPMFNMLPSRILQPLSKDLIPTESHTFIVICSYSSSTARLSWLTFINFFTPCLQLVEVAYISLAYHVLLWFGVIHELFEVHSVPPWRPLMRPYVSSQRTLILTDCQIDPLTTILWVQLSVIFFPHFVD